MYRYNYLACNRFWQELQVAISIYKTSYGLNVKVFFRQDPDDDVTRLKLICLMKLSKPKCNISLLGNLFYNCKNSPLKFLGAMD